MGLQGSLSILQPPAQCRFVAFPDAALAASTAAGLGFRGDGAQLATGLRERLLQLRDAGAHSLALGQAWVVTAGACKSIGGIHAIGIFTEIDGAAQARLCGTMPCQQAGSMA